MFDIDTFIDRCQSCLAETEPRRAIRETLTEAVHDATSVAAAMQPRAGGLTLLHRSEELTVVHVVWAPGMDLFAHDHRMWACIGIYTGREDNTFFRRPTDSRSGLTGSGGKTLDEGDVVLLGDDTIHAVSNPLGTLTGALHVYGGDFVAQPRSQWLPPELDEAPYDSEVVNRAFADANDKWLSEPHGRTP
jgi:predicted metal-dependent enzyme (double-stranded beta helix superfamily)